MEENLALANLSTKHFCTLRLQPTLIDMPHPDTFLQTFVTIIILSSMDLGLDPVQWFLKPGIQPQQLNGSEQVTYSS